MSDPIRAISSNYILKQWTVQYVPNRWSVLIPANPSRWHLLICLGFEQALLVSPFNDGVITQGLQASGGKNYHEFCFSHSPVLTTSAWFVACPALIPVGTVEAWETTMTGT